MKRNGSIMIFVLLTFMLISTGALFAIYMSRDQVEIANNSITKIQSQYLAESKINKIFYDDRYYNAKVLPSIMDHNKDLYPEYTLKKSDIFFEDNNTVNGRFYNFDGKRYLELSTMSEYQGIESNLKAYGTVFNDIFYDNNPALSYNNINDEHSEKFKVFMGEISEKINLDNLPSNIKGMEFSGYESVRMRNASANNYNIITKSFYEDESILSETLGNTNRIFMIVRNPNTSQRARLNINDYIYSRGIIYVEGDLIINSDFRFLGVIIVKGNIIIDKSLESKPRIEGAIVYDGEIDLDDWDLRYNITNMNTFGIYLPNFIEPKLQVYKFMK